MKRKSKRSSQFSRERNSFAVIRMQWPTQDFITEGFSKARRAESGGEVLGDRLGVWGSAVISQRGLWRSPLSALDGVSCCIV